MTEIGFIQFKGVTGSVEEANHKDWSAIYSISTSISRPVANTSGRQTIEKGTLNDITVVKGFDKSSPVLFQKSAMGEVFPQVIIEQVSNVGGNNASVVNKTTLTNVYISNYSSSAAQSSSGTLPLETLQLNYSKIEVEYTQIGVDGKTGGKSKGSWDVAKGAPN